MKKLLLISILLISAFMLTACGTDKNAMVSIEDGQMQMMEISEQLMNGEISQEDANKKMEEISKNMESIENTMKDAYKNVSDFDGLPKWAKSLGLYELNGFEFVKSESSVTEYDKHYGMWESISLVYTYDDEAKAIQAAEKLVASAGMKESSGHSPRILQKNLDKTMESMREYMPEEDKIEYEKNKMSGYISDEIKWDYSIMISVLEGQISILATNIAQAGN